MFAGASMRDTKLPFENRWSFAQSADSGALEIVPTNQVALFSVPQNVILRLPKKSRFPLKKANLGEFLISNHS